MKWMKSAHVLLILFVMLNSVAAEAINALTQLDAHEENSQLILAFKFEESVDYHCMQLKNPDRFVIDFENTQLQTKLNPLANSFVKNVRSSDHEHYLRLVFDMNQRLQYVTKLSKANRELKITLKNKDEKIVAAKLKKSSKEDLTAEAEEMLALAQEKPSKTHIDKKLNQSVSDQTRLPASDIAAPSAGITQKSSPDNLSSSSHDSLPSFTRDSLSPSSRDSTPTSSRDTALSSSRDTPPPSSRDIDRGIQKSHQIPKSMARDDEDRTSKPKKFVVVIDPGHGGKDPGAAGAQGAVEKDVVLKISKQLQEMLNQEPGFSAILTRTNDRFITLRNRLAIARKHHADLFVAVHADAYHHSQATGASVYALSSRGATSEAARWLAEKENESELGGLGIELADKDALLRSVLIDLSQTHTIESSLQIGHSVLKNLGQLGRLHHSRVEQAAFVVLKSPDIPSILVETGFLSNALEEEKLTNPDYQYRTALAVKDGIKQYFKNNTR